MLYILSAFNGKMWMPRVLTIFAVHVANLLELPQQRGSNSRDEARGLGRSILLRDLDVFMDEYCTSIGPGLLPISFQDVVSHAEAENPLVFPKLGTTYEMPQDGTTYDQALGNVQRIASIFASLVQDHGFKIDPEHFHVRKTKLTVGTPDTDGLYYMTHGWTKGQLSESQPCVVVIACCRKSPSLQGGELTYKDEDGVTYTLDLGPDTVIMLRGDVEYKISDISGRGSVEVFDFRFRRLD